MRWTLTSLHEQEVLRGFLEQDRGRYAYLLGDLDPRFWGRTVWYGAVGEGGLEAVVMVFMMPRRATVLAFGEDAAALGWLLEALTGLLPARFDLHIEREQVARVEALGWPLRSVKPFRRMVLEAAVEAPEGALVWLTEADGDAVAALYEASYPENAYDPSMLATGRYVGWRGEAGALEAIAGVHVYAPGEGVAALGNITAHPASRGKGRGRAVTAALCARLQGEGLRTVALNVRDDNAAAIALYESLGFVTVLRYVEAVCAP